MYDIKAVRRHFPHTKKSIYFNVASTGPIGDPACRILEAYFRKTQMGEVGDQREMFDALENIRRYGAKIFGCRKGEAGFGFNTTFGLNLAAFGLPLKKGDEVILSNAEFPANVYPWLALRERGVKIKFINNDGGYFDLGKLEKAISPRTRVLTVSFVQYFNGFKMDMDSIADLCRRHKIFLVLDSIQGAGCEKMNVARWDVAVASAGAQKWLLSPQGTGLFYVSEKIRDKMQSPWRSWLSVDWKCRWHDLRRLDMQPVESAQKYELGTYPGALVMALDWTLGFITGLGISNIQKHNHALLDSLIEYLSGEPFYRITSSLEPKHRSSILSFTTDQCDIAEVHRRLASRRIVTSMREGSIRVSAHLYNDQSDMDRLIDELHRAAGKLKRK